MKRLSILGLCLLLSLPGCGYAPVYASRDSSATGAARGAPAGLAGVLIATIPDRQGQVLRNRLLDRFRSGPAQPATHELRVELVERSRDLGIRRDDTVRRAQLAVRANLVLLDLTTGQPVLRSEVRSINSYNLLDNPFGARIARADAEDRGLEDLANQISLRLAAYFRDPGSFPTPLDQVEDPRPIPAQRPEDEAFPQAPVPGDGDRDPFGSDLLSPAPAPTP